MFSGEDVYRPSYFEMIAAERLLPSLKPAVQHVCRVLGRHQPWLRWLPGMSEEVFAFLHWHVERHSLRAYDASFSEQFYGLKRVAVRLPPAGSSGPLSDVAADPARLSSALFGAEAVHAAAAAATQRQAGVSSAATAASPPGAGAASSASAGGGASAFFAPLNSSDRRRALFFLVTLPYWKAKCDAVFVRMRDGVDEEGFQIIYDPSQHSRLFNLCRRLFLRLYPYYHLLYCAIPLLYNLRFLLEQSVFYSPELETIGQVLRRQTFDDMNAPPPPSRPPPSRPGLVGSLLRAQFHAGSWLSRNAKYLLLFGVIAFKFVEWWYSPANAYYAERSAGGGQRLPIPPPPKPPRPSASGLPLPEDSTLCPLCEQERTNPAATPTGYVFCYSCIHRHISTHRNCPVTLRPCTVEQLRKIYEN